MLPSVPPGERANTVRSRQHIERRPYPSLAEMEPAAAKTLPSAPAVV